MNINITNMHDKFDGTYTNLPLGGALLTPDVLSFADFVEMAIYTKTQLYPDKDRIDFSIACEVFSKWDDIPFDVFKISLYREGYELEKGYTSNYMYMEGEEGDRLFWIDLYYSPESYDSDNVFRDIIREINNFKNRDFEEYLNSL